MCSYSKLASIALCQLVHDKFLKASSEASGISHGLRQDDAPDRSNHRHLFFPHLPELNYTFTHFYWKGMSISGFDFFLWHTV